MGNRLICMTKKDSKEVGSRSKRMGGGGRSQRKLVTEEELHLQALSMALQQHSQRFEGSMSRRIGSTSSRRRTLPDSVPVNKQVLLFFFSFQFLFWVCMIFGLLIVKF